MLYAVVTNGRIVGLVNRDYLKEIDIYEIPVTIEDPCDLLGEYVTILEEA